jgi:hypothetical protein
MDNVKMPCVLFIWCKVNVYNKDKDKDRDKDRDTLISIINIR